MFYLQSHTDNALYTKFFYYIIRYLLYRNKDSFKDYNLTLAKFDGSDFSLNDAVLPENIRSRFITAKFIAYNAWLDEELNIIDAINPLGSLYAITDAFDPDSYASTTGIVSVPDSVDLSDITVEHYFVDADNEDFRILGDISNVNGSKGFRIKVGQTVSVATGAYIKQRYSLYTEAESEREDSIDYTWETREED